MKTIVKLTVATLLAMSAAAPAFAFNPEAQLLDERSMSAVGQNQAFNAHAEVRSWAGTRR